MTLRGVGWVAAGLAALALGLLAAFVVVALAVGQNCPWYDDEGLTAAPGSPYTAVLCGSQGDPLWGLGAVGLASVVLAVAVVVLARGVPQAPWVAVALLAVAPVVLMIVLHVVLPRDCLGGPDGTHGTDGTDSTATCETNRELL